MFEYELHMYLLTIVVFISIEMMFFSLTDISIIDIITQLINNLLNTNFYFKDYVYIVAGIAGLLIAFKRDNWLPFLGRSVFPHSILQQQTPTQHGLLIKYGGVQWITRFFYKKMVYKKV